ncbi:unnamed protein product [Allacma fusca]|uniref:Uncharacterized protein n=1 Tax=Allacma fusca TaxID=39272 RepID=A0A8J2PVX5_9HEXA|nr:unnamed protein product [Allacma fusca]
MTKDNTFLSKMADLPVDQFERPLQFRPSWPPRAEEKQACGWGPGFSLAFRKSSWPPPSDSDETSGSATGLGATGSNGPDSNNSASAANPSQGTVGSQNNASEIVRPKKQVRDYSNFYAKNASPASRRVWGVQPGSVQLPEAFTGTGEEENE